MPAISRMLTRKPQSQGHGSASKSVAPASASVRRNRWTLHPNRRINHQRYGGSGLGLAICQHSRLPWRQDRHAEQAERKQRFLQERKRRSFRSLRLWSVSWRQSANSVGGENDRRPRLAGDQALAAIARGDTEAAASHNRSSDSDPFSPPLLAMCWTKPDPSRYGPWLAQPRACSSLRTPSARLNQSLLQCLASPGISLFSRMIRSALRQGRPVEEPSSK
jgi:hypothetical protein